MTEAKKPAKGKHKPGERRSPEEREELAKEIVRLMNDDELDCYAACKQVGVKHSTFLLWADKDPKLADIYARARDDLISRMAYDIVRISDTPVGSTDSGMTDSGAVQKQKLQVDTRKWLLARLAPRKYGDRLALAGDETAPIKVEQTIDVSKLPTDVLAQIMAAKDNADNGG